MAQRQSRDVETDWSGPTTINLRLQFFNTAHLHKTSIQTKALQATDLCRWVRAVAELRANSVVLILVFNHTPVHSCHGAAELKHSLQPSPLGLSADSHKELAAD